MIKNSLRVMALFLASALFFGMNINVNAAALSGVLPNSGITTAMAKGTTLGDMHAESGTDITVASIVNEEEVRAVQEMQMADEGNAIPYENLVIASAVEYVNVRSTPNEKGKVVGKFYKDAIAELVSVENGWYYIRSGNVEGYVNSFYCLTEDKAMERVHDVGTRLAVVNCEGLYVRKDATTDSEVIRMSAQKDELLVLDETEDWVKVDVEEGFGWVAKQFVDLKTEFIYAETKEEERARLASENDARERAKKAALKKSASDIVITGDNEMGVAVAEYAIQFVGNPYVWGGTSLTKGADCSGFVMKVYEEFGISLPHSSAADRRMGYAVNGGLKNAQPGDLICYSGHVALYIGDGMIVHAASEKSGIKISKANYRTILAIRRIF